MQRIKQTGSSVKKENKIISDAMKYLCVDEFFTPEINELRMKIRSDIEPIIKSFINDDIEKANFPERAFPPIFAANLGIHYVRKPFGKGKCLKSLFATVLELARIDGSVATAYLVNFILFANTIDDYGSEEQRAFFLPKIIKGEIMGGWGLTERDVGSDASNLKTNCQKLPNGDWKINGNKRWIGNGDRDYMIVFARDIDSKHVKAFIVDLTLPGITRAAIQHKMALRGVQNIDVEFRDVIVKPLTQLPKVQSFEAVAAMLEHSRIGVAMLACGIGIGTYEHTIQYLNQRMQFGKKLVAFQLVQEKLVRMMGNVQASLLVVCKMIELSIQNKSSIGRLGMTKSWVTLRIREVVSLGRELLGGNGIITDHYVMKAFCDMEAVYTYEGTYDINALVCGRELTGISAFK